MSIKEMMQENVNTNSSPSELKITDIRFADIEGGPFENSLIKIETNQGITGFGEVRDFGCKQYALMLKSRLLHENPCDVDRLFHRIKQFGHHGRQGGGVSGIELALWDIVGKVYSVPVYQLIGGKYRDKIDVYCDTDVYGKHDGKAMGEALKKRMEKGFKLLKMDVGIDLLLDEPGMLCGPKWILDAMRRDADMPKFTRSDGSVEGDLREKAIYDLYNIEHPFTGIQITEKGLDYLEQYVADARSVVGYEIPISIDHFGHIGVNDCIKLLRRLEKYNIAWAEDLLPWQYLGQYRKIASATAVPLCTGEDTYGKEAFREIIQSGAFSVVHPDILTSGGILETKKIGEIAEGKNAIVGLVTSGGLNVLGNDGRCSVIGREIGFENIGVDANIDTSTHGNEASFEFIVEKNPQYLFIMDRDAAIQSEGAKLAQEIVENELVMGTDVYKNGNIIYLAHPAVWYTAEGGITALDLMLQDLETELLD